MENIFLTLLAAVVSGTLATIIAIIFNNKLEKKREKKNLAEDLFGYRFQLNNSKGDRKELCNALGRVPIVFNSDKGVIDSYRILFEAILNGDKASDDKLVNFYRSVALAAKLNSHNWNDNMFTGVIS